MKKMDNAKKVFIGIAIVIALAILLFKPITRDGLSIVLTFLDVAFLIALFSPLSKYKEHFKSVYVFSIILSLVNEGILKNEGGHNLGLLMVEILIKASIWIVISLYLQDTT